MVETKIMNGKETSNIIKKELSQKVIKLKEQGITPTLAVILVGENDASKVYVKNKQQACEEIGIKSIAHILPEDTPENELLSLIYELNNADNIDGILVQLPVPKHINPAHIIDAISVQKDVDGFHKLNIGSLLTGDTGFVSCTPAGIMELLNRHNIEVSGKKCVVVGRSNSVGKPMGLLLLNSNATVTFCHSKTQNLSAEIKQADIVIVAIGRAKFVTGDMLKEGAIVIDVGINRDKYGKLCGDVDFDSCQNIAEWITPVPKGVGPMTVVMLMHNCVQSATNKANRVNLLA